MRDKCFVVKLLTFCLFSIYLLSACSNAEKYQHIEVFMIETSEQNNEGIFEKTGYKKINSITTIEEGKNHIKTDIKAVEDFYDIDGKYIKTAILHYTYEKSKVTLVEKGEDKKGELQEPSTILIRETNVDYFQLDNMTDEEKEKVKEHVLSFMDKL